MMNLGLTVKELMAACIELYNNGDGDKHIVISGDDEGNNFHTLFYSFTTEPKDVEDCLMYEQDGTHTVDNCVILG